MQISFYVLGNRFMTHDKAIANNNTASNDTTNEQSTAPEVNFEAVLNFICKLTQTVLKKSDLSLMIVDDKSERLKQLDTKLWSFDSTSFVPHHLMQDSNLVVIHTGSNKANSDIIKSNNDDFSSSTSNSDSSHINSNPTNSSQKDSNNIHLNPQSHDGNSSNISAPVTLINTLPSGFDGVVLNLAATPIELSDTSIFPERILEIITPDDISKQQGRDKYRLYRDLGFEVIYFPIN